jgi:hypothetical protein
MLAEKYVSRGARWLNRHAPRGWYRNCLNGGHSRIRTSYGHEGILAISFEYCEEFADNSGYINEGKVLRYFDLPVFSDVVYRLGFETPLSDFRPFPRRPTITITNQMLDAAWAKLLKEPPAEWRIPYRHPTAFDLRSARMDFIDQRRRPSIFGWILQVMRPRHPALLP